MVTVILGAVINLVLDPLFIFGFHMGVQGAALATVIAQFCSAVWVLLFLTGNRPVLRLEWKPEYPIVKDIVLEVSPCGFCHREDICFNQSCQ